MLDHPEAAHAASEIESEAHAADRARFAMQAESAATLLVQIVLGLLVLLGIVHVVGWLA